MAYSLYQYEPSKPAAIIAIICYALSSLYHIYQLIQLKAYFFTTFIVGALSTSPFTLPLLLQITNQITQ